MEFIEKFREALRIPTWWPSDKQEGDKTAEEPLVRFQNFLLNNFPAFNKTAERWVLSPYSVVYRLQGSGSSDDAVLFLAHYDVVPAEKDKWTSDPFGAEMKDGFIYGRGSLDMKSVLISVAEAAETLCSENLKPKRDIWFVFSGDEERTGILGAGVTAQWFEKRGQRFDFIIDEGTPVAENQIKDIASPLALVSIEEKGYLSLKLSVSQEPGHSSRPPKVQAAAVLGRALCKIAEKPFPFRLGTTTEAFFRQIAPMVPGIQGFVMRHARAFGSLFFKAAASSPEAASMLRTTTAITQLKGSAADNVMPSQVDAIINLRLLYPWTTETASDFIRKAINDERVSIGIHGTASNPVMACNNYEQHGWTQVKAALEKVYPGIPMIPFIMTAITDSRHYQKLCNSTFRFIPYKLDSKELSGIHGHDERISEENLRRGLMFYTALMRLL
jgi:carboxypeptidase PM20D1